MDALVDMLSGRSVMIVGDLMLDHYLLGNVERISPEAPVPVVEVHTEKTLLGGAGNVARNISSLGGSPLLVGVVGDDFDGQCVADHCRDARIQTRFVATPGRPTTKKTRVIAHNQQVVRVDHEHTAILEDRVYDELFAVIEAEMPKHKAVILSDYGKGLVSKTFMKRFMKCVENCPERPTILVDPKTRNFDLYIGVDVLTPNRKEASEGARMSASDQQQIMAAGKTIINGLNCNHLLITLGADGMAFFESPDEVYHIPTMARTVFDVTGAGDTVIATMALALSAGATMLEASVLANHAAGIVVGQVGAATTNPKELLAALENHPPYELTRW